MGKPGKTPTTAGARQLTRPKPPPNYLSRREQYRVFILCATLMLVLGLMNEARKPSNWQWLWANENQTVQQPPIDTKIVPIKRQLPVDGFTSHPSPARTAMPSEQSPNAEEEPTFGVAQDGVAQDGVAQDGVAQDGAGRDEAVQDDAVQGDIAQNLPPNRSGSFEQIHSQPADASETKPNDTLRGVLTDGEQFGNASLTQWLPGVTPALLQPIEDNTMLVVRAKEQEAWRVLLGILAETNQADLVAQSTGKVGFAQLFRQTSIYRGKLVTVEGNVRRVEEIKPPENELGIETFFRWIVQPTGGANAPFVIYSLEKPADFQVEDNFHRFCQFTGFCFKRWAYKAVDGTRIAPLLLAKNATWQPPPPPEPVTLPSRTKLVSILAGCGLLAACVAFIVYRSSIAKQDSVQRVRASQVGDLRQIDQAAVLPSITESLQLIADDNPQPIQAERHDDGIDSNNASQPHG